MQVCNLGSRDLASDARKHMMRARLSFLSVREGFGVAPHGGRRPFYSLSLTNLPFARPIPLDHSNQLFMCVVVGSLP